MKVERPDAAQLQILLRVEPPDGPDAALAWARCAAAVGPVAAALPWTGGAPDATQAQADGEGGMIWALAIDGSDRRRSWRELCQVVGLALLWSRLLPTRIFRVEDPTGLLAASLDLNAPLVLMEGQATRPRRHGPPAPAANLQGPLRLLLQEVLGPDAERLGLLPEPVPVEAPEGDPAPTARPLAGHQGSPPQLVLDRAALLPASPETLQPAALDLALRVSDPAGPQAQRADLLVVLRDAAGDPLGVALLPLPPPSAGGSAAASWQEPLTLDPGAVATVEMQLRLHEVQRIEGHILMGGGQP